MASIEKRGKDSYRLIVEGGVDADGKRIKQYRTVRAKNKTEAKVELAKFVAEIESGSYVAPEKMTLHSFFLKWKEISEQRELLAPKTQLNYEGYYKSHIKPVFGHLQIDSIKTMQILDFFNELEKPGMRKDGKPGRLSSGTLDTIYRAFRNILNRAKEWNVIKVNPIAGVKKPKVETKRVTVFEKPEAEAAIAVLMEKMPLMWQCYYIGTLLGGYRRGEMNALQWPNVFFEHNQIYVEKSISLTKNQKVYEGPPKNKASEDFVDMPSWYMDLLRLWYEGWKRERAESIDAGEWLGGKNEYVFHAGKGKPIFYNWPSMKWKGFLEKHGIRHINFHSLRHTMVSLLLEEDVPLGKIQKRVRHASSKTTSDIYAHLTKKAGRDMASSFDSLNPFSKSVPNPSPSAVPVPDTGEDETP